LCDSNSTFSLAKDNAVGAVGSVRSDVVSVNALDNAVARARATPGLSEGTCHLLESAELVFHLRKALLLGDWAHAFDISLGWDIALGSNQQGNRYKADGDSSSDTLGDDKTGT
jgi:hypothetical protein